MILVGSQRGGAGNLARHLMNDRDNDHVELLEVRGFASRDLEGALAEADAISKGTKCKQFMFSLSLNPPKGFEVTKEDLISAVDRAEEALGLKGQPRALVSHEKDGRRHMHVVWSRIDADQMKAINLPHFKNRLNALSKELYLEHGWELPRGHQENGGKSPLNFTLAEWQQCKRLDLDPREVKQVFQEAFKASDNQRAFKAALEEKGYFLAAGDKRGFVALDVHGEAFSVSRMTGAKSKEVTERLGSPEGLPSVEKTQKSIRLLLGDHLKARLSEFKERQREALRPLNEQRDQLVEKQRAFREKIHGMMEERRIKENRIRAERMRTGIMGVFDILTGKARMIREQNEREAFAGYRRDTGQREQMALGHLRQREALQRQIDAVKREQRGERMAMMARVASVLRVRGVSRNTPEHERSKPRPRGFGRD